MNRTTETASSGEMAAICLNLKEGDAVRVLFEEQRAIASALTHSRFAHAMITREGVDAMFDLGGELCLETDRHDGRIIRRCLKFMDNVLCPAIKSASAGGVCLSFSYYENANLRPIDSEQITLTSVHLDRPALRALVYKVL